MEPGITDILGLDKGGSLLQGIDSLLGPGVGLLLNGAKRGIAHTPPAPGPLLAVAHQHGNHIRRKAKVPDKAQQDFQFLGVQTPAQQPLHLSVQAAEGLVGVHGVQHVPLRVAGPLPGGNVAGTLLGHQSQLAQCGPGAAESGGRQIQFPLRLRQGIPAGQVYVKQGSVRAGRTQ